MESIRAENENRDATASTAEQRSSQVEETIRAITQISSTTRDSPMSMLSSLYFSDNGEHSHYLH